MQELIYHSIYKVSQARGSGSCFYLKDYNLFVTNSHVVEGFRQVALEDHHRNRYPARVILAHPALDVAFLKAESDFSFLPDLPLAKEEAAIGSKIRVAGYPFGCRLPLRKVLFPLPINTWTVTTNSKRMPLLIQATVEVLC